MTDEKKVVKSLDLTGNKIPNTSAYLTNILVIGNVMQFLLM